jgi:hypothetical protein
MNITETATKAGAALHLAQEHVEHLGRSANGKFDEARIGAADAFENAASSVRSTGHQGAEAIDAFSRSSAGKLDFTAAYMRSHDAGAMLRNVHHWLLGHPAGFMLLAASVGFLAGSAIHKRKLVG